ncbi:MAG: hypothetical protein LIQ31_02160 [Planctomycetes bacterium]|nr:hypothetical protein [Planctomycetota bacterium]
MMETLMERDESRDPPRAEPDDAWLAWRSDASASHTAPRQILVADQNSVDKLHGK